MRKSILSLFLVLSGAAAAQLQDLALLQKAAPFSDTAASSTPATVAKAAIVSYQFATCNLQALIGANRPSKTVLAYSKNNRPVEAWYFPGTGNKRAMVIGGVHGSELSAIAVAQQVVATLLRGERPYYSVLIVPSLFPDNAATAARCPHHRILHNTGRYTHPTAIDPNRQLPLLGKPFYLDSASDAYGRAVEKENAVLLQLIQAFAPQRIVSLHAIKDFGRAGVYADPRTDNEGRALGFATDSALALAMAAQIEQSGGTAAGNRRQVAPTALYYLDPATVAPGLVQPRNLAGMNQKGKIAGVSLGSWAATAVWDQGSGYARPAIRMLTVEFPGYKQPSEFSHAEDKDWCRNLIKAYASAIHGVFLQAFFVEEEDAAPATVTKT